MNSALAMRISKLEARKAKAKPKVVYYIGERFPDRIEIVDGIARRRAYFTEKAFEEFARNQQACLLAELTKLAIQLDEPLEPPTLRVGIAGDRAPLAPGKKAKRFIFRNELGREIQIDTHTGEKTYV